MNNMHPNFTPERLGPFLLQRVLGEGGMGRVYLARQETPVERMVALKVIKPGRETAAINQRLERERQWLAMLNHPFVAKIFDAGTTTDGSPYFAMEYIDGVPVTEYADQAQLRTADRLHLFLSICEGIQHAHQKGIIHRDIKPSNILVTEIDGRPVPKIIDFGVAKDLLSDQTQTAEGELLGTPRYMSPEQVQGEPLDIRTDVYALGVLLYELLIGRLPFGDDATNAYRYMNRLVHEDPPSLSKVVSASGDDTDTGETDVSFGVGPERRRLLRQLKGDLDWIAAKSLNRVRDLRYASVSELAGDIQRHLDCEPVLAGPPTHLYRMRKFFARHRLAVIASCLIFISLATGFVTSRISLKKARLAQQMAMEQSEKNAAINAFLNDLLTSVDPRRDGRDVKVVDLLDRQMTELSRSFVDQPLVEASIRHTVGTAFSGLGLYERAEEELIRAHELRKSRLGLEHESTWTTDLSLARLYVAMGRYDRAKQLVDTMGQYPINGADMGLRLQTGLMKGQVMYKVGELAGASEQLASVLEAMMQQLGPSDLRTLSCKRLYAGTLRRLGRYVEAESVLTGLLEQESQTLGLDHPDTLETLNNLGSTLLRMGKLEQCETLYRQTYETRLAVLGPNHHQTALSLNNLGVIAYKQKRYQEAEQHHREALDVLEKNLGPDHLDALITRNNLGNALRRQERWEAAERLYADTAARLESQFGMAHHETYRTHLNWIKVLDHHQRFSEIVTIARKLCEARPELVDGYSRLGWAALAMGDNRQAADAFKRAIVIDSHLTDEIGLAQALCEVDRDEALNQFALLATREMEPAWIEAEVMPWLLRLPQGARVNELIARFKQMARDTE